MPPRSEDRGSPVYAIQIAMNYLERSGEIENYTDACRFVIQEVASLMRQGERNRLVLANLAIAAFQRDRAARIRERVARIID